MSATTDEIAADIGLNVRVYDSPVIDTDKDIAFSAKILRDSLLQGEVLNKDERAQVMSLAKISMDLKKLNVEEESLANDRELLSAVTDALAKRGMGERPKIEKDVSLEVGRDLGFSAEEVSEAAITTVPGELEVAPEALTYATFINGLKNK